MKKFTIILLLLVLSAATFSQQITPSFTRQDYLKKSKTQKTVGWILLGAGTTMMVAGSIVWSNAVEEDGSIFAAWTTTKGSTLTAVGFFTALGSIPVFIIAGKNKRKATASLTYKNEYAPKLVNSFLVNHKIPSLTLRVDL